MRGRLPGMVLARWLAFVVALAGLSACDPAAAATTLEALPTVPGDLRLYTAALDGEAPLVFASGTGFEMVVWRWSGASWDQVVDLGGQRGAVYGLVTEPRGGAWVAIRRQATDGTETVRFARILDGVVTELAAGPAIRPLGLLSDGSLLATGADATWRLPPGATDWVSYSSDLALLSWTGVILPDDQLPVLQPDGLYVFDAAGAKRKVLPCGEWLCSVDTPGVGLVGGAPHMVFGDIRTTTLPIMRLDLAAGTMTKVGEVGSESPGGQATFVSAVHQLAVTEKRWYAVRTETYGGEKDGWLVHRGLEASGEPVLVTKTLTLGGALLVSPKSIWAYEPRERRFSRLPR